MFWEITSSFISPVLTKGLYSFNSSANLYIGSLNVLNITTFSLLLIISFVNSIALSILIECIFEVVSIEGNAVDFLNLITKPYTDLLFNSTLSTSSHIPFSTSL